MTENEAKEFLTNFTLDRIGYANEKEVDVKRFNYFTDVLKTAIVSLDEIQQYRTIGTVTECREAMEKQRAKKPQYKYLKSFPNCPNCGEVNLQRENEYGNIVENYSYCPDCGQAIDWSDTE